MPKRNNRQVKKSIRPYTSPRQLIAVKNLSKLIRSSKGRRGITLGKIMKEAGYSDSTSLRPTQLVQSERFQQLLDKHLPDDLIAKVHEEALTASALNHYVFPKTEDNEVIKETIESVSGCKLIKIRQITGWKRAYYQSPDNQSRLKAIAEAYKVKDKYPKAKIEHSFDEELKDFFLGVRQRLPK